MKLIDKEIILVSESETFTIFPIGDVHIGNKNCAEGHFRRYVDHIKNTTNSYWIGGGDYCECITPTDVKRFDFRALPDWMFNGNCTNIRDALSDLALQQRRRFNDIIEPIKHKGIGLIEGNHEYNLMQHGNNAHHYLMCEELGLPNLTDAAFIRLNFRRKKPSGTSGSTITMAIVHGSGGGRTAGAEPNHLDRLSRFLDADIILRGHSHTFDIEAPQVFLYVPQKGVMPDELCERSTYKANWGCWVKSYANGVSTYDSRANYPARPLRSMEIIIKPFHSLKIKSMGRETTRKKTKITIRECDYEY